MFYIIVDLIICGLCLLAGFFPNIQWIVIVAWIGITLLLIIDLVGMLRKGLAGLIGCTICSIILPMVIVLCVTKFAFNFIDIRTLYFGFAGSAALSIICQIDAL